MKVATQEVDVRKFFAQAMPFRRGLRLVQIHEGAFQIVGDPFRGGKSKPGVGPLLVVGGCLERPFVGRSEIGYRSEVVQDFAEHAAKGETIVGTGCQRETAFSQRPSAFVAILRGLEAGSIQIGPRVLGGSVGAIEVSGAKDEVARLRPVLPPAGAARAGPSAEEANRTPPSTDQSVGEEENHRPEGLTSRCAIQACAGVARVSRSGERSASRVELLAQGWQRLAGPACRPRRANPCAPGLGSAPKWARRPR